MEIKKIKCKEAFEVQGQSNCTVVGKPKAYYDDEDCEHDCNAFVKAPWYKSRDL